MRQKKSAILFLVPYPVGSAPSQRFRFEQYFPILKYAGFTWATYSFVGTQTWRNLFVSGKSLHKFFGILYGFIKRIFVMLLVPRFDFVFIHREASPIGPPIFEWIIAKVFRKKIIYDFDDAIWLSDSDDESAIFRWLKHRRKVALICSWSHAVSAGNNYLSSFAENHNKRVLYNPTTIDTQHLHNPDLFQKSPSEIIIIGWTGSHSTLKYLTELEVVLQKLETTYKNIRFRVIADQQPKLNLKHLEFIPWRKETEIEDLMKFDIKIMPLTDTVWERGKCGFKALQYMALKIPAVVSPVGVNSIIVLDRVNGLLCSTPEEWFDKLSLLITHPQERRRLGAAGRNTVIENYSLESNRMNFLSLFK